MEYRTLSEDQIRAETIAIAEIRARLAVVTHEIQHGSVYAIERQGLELQRLIDTRKNTKVFLLSTDWGKANPPPRDFRITLAKAWPQGEIGLPQKHINWLREALLHSEEKPAARPS